MLAFDCILPVDDGFLLTRVEMVDSKPTNPCCKALVEPELIPPIHSNKVTKPLVGKFWY